VFTVLGVDTAM